MRRALARLAASGLRAASVAECEALANLPSARALAIGAWQASQRVGCASQWAPTRAFTASPSWASAEGQDYAGVWYPESEAEVGEAAPAFSLPGEW